MKSRFVIPAFVVVVALFGFVAFSGGSATAQQATASPTAESHPGHIHNGSCPEIGSVAWALNDATAANLMATPVVGTPMALPTMPPGASPIASMGEVVASSVTTVKVHLQDLEKAPFAINFHESAENIQNYIACGDIKGQIADGWLIVVLNELNDSGFNGVAWLHDNGDGTTTVTVQLMKKSGV